MISAVSLIYAFPTDVAKHPDESRRGVEKKVWRNGAALLALGKHHCVANDVRTDEDEDANRA